eukprot:TRINITY_DN80880_c0_g1_i1.p1 TRINITY_DN80880_c0_g1~~TRINITY_DN80880_c0_g1_i1.p1  ORF type:complete len:133 (-),score=34.42 TRINITY_DN80880_c0_g1_i1:54-452(-)
MPPRRLTGKTHAEESKKASPKKRARTKDEDEDEEKQAVVPRAGNTEVALTTRGGGRGLKAVQNAREQSSIMEKRDGSRAESKTSVKEQKLYNAKNNAHVETKVLTENRKKTTKKDGTVVTTESKTSRKVSYL